MAALLYMMISITDASFRITISLHKILPCEIAAYVRGGQGFY
jgi:hypothetical protein